MPTTAAGAVKALLTDGNFALPEYSRFTLMPLNTVKQDHQKATPISVNLLWVLLSTYSPPSVDRIWGIWGSYYNIPKAIFYLLKGAIGFRVRGDHQRTGQFQCLFELKT